MDGATYLIDSTSVRLSALSERWARFSATACGAKAHIVYDPDADRPDPRCGDAGPRHRPHGRQGDAHRATYVFDLGYYDYGWWAELHECRIVTRFKTNTHLTVEERAADARRRRRPRPGDGGVILSDRVGRLPGRPPPEPVPGAGA